MQQINGSYFVVYKSPRMSCERDRRQYQHKLQTFEGACENFVSTGVCAFRNKENEMLLVDYQDIVQMFPL